MLVMIKIQGGNCLENYAIISVRGEITSTMAVNKIRKGGLGEWQIGTQK